MQQEGVRDISEQDQNIQVVKEGYEAFTAGDMETLMSLLDDNIEWIQPGQSAISGTYHGKGDLSEYMSRMAEKSTTVQPHRFLADGDTVEVLSETTAGGETSQDADVFTLRDGKLIRAQVYGDTGVSSDRTRAIHQNVRDGLLSDNRNGLQRREVEYRGRFVGQRHPQLAHVDGVGHLGGNLQLAHPVRSGPQGVLHFVFPISLRLAAVT